MSQRSKAGLAAIKSYRNLKGFTPLQTLATQRNWCYYILAGMDALTEWMHKKNWLTGIAAANLSRAINSARFSVDNQWYAKVDIERSQGAVIREERNARRRRA